MPNFSSLYPRVLWITFGIATLLAILLAVWMKISEDGISVSILEFEFVLTDQNASTFLKELGDGGINLMRKQIWIDFLFIPAYVIAIVSLWMLYQHYFQIWELPYVFLSFSTVMIILAILAGIYDLIENSGLLKVLKGEGYPWPLISTIFATLKWAAILPPLLIGVPLLLVLVPIGGLIKKK